MDTKLMKFTKIIESINSKIRQCSSWTSRDTFDYESSTAKTLEFIFDLEKMNDYAKAIYSTASIILTDYSREDDLWAKSFSSKTKDKYALDSFIEYNNNGYNDNERDKFIFWALMILTVDKTNAEEHLSTICDFAQMLEISDDEFEDIIHVINKIYKQEDTTYSFKTEIVPKIFGDLPTLH